MAKKKGKSPARKKPTPRKSGRKGITLENAASPDDDSAVADQQEELALGGDGEIITTSAEGESQDEEPAKPVKEKGKRGRKPAQARLPEMDDPEIAELEGLAEEYAEFRDKRMRAGEREIELKEDLLKAMKRHKRERYLHNGIEIRVVKEEETIKVKITRED